MSLWLGADRRLAAKRLLVNRSERQSGLFSKSDDLSWNYRIDLTNASPKPARIEVWDRIPVAPDNRITVQLADLAPSLADDSAYLADDRPRGLLKWVVEAPAASPGSAPQPFPIRWTVRLSKPAGLSTTPLPE
jgi:hypothetical protein